MQRDTMAEKGEGSVTGKRRAEEDLDGGAGGGSRAGKPAGFVDEEELLPGPRLGGGPVWRLPEGPGVGGAERDGKGGALFRCGALLEQALSCSEYADVRFVFDDGQSHVSGHRGMLCCVSGEFGGMFGCGMVEAKSGEVRVRGVERASFRGFLEYLYLGQTGKEMGFADGREVWVLADLYDMQGVKEWLMAHGLNDKSVCAAAQYALEGGGFLSGLLQACKRYASTLKGLSGIGEEALRGVSAEAAGVVLEAFLARGKGGNFVNGMMVEGFKYVERWARANRLSGGVSSLVGLIELDKVSPRDLMHIVRPSGLLREGHIDSLYEQRLGGGRLEGRRLGVVKSFGACSGQFLGLGSLAGEQRVVVGDDSGERARVFDVSPQSPGTLVLNAGTDDGPGQLDRPFGVALSVGGKVVVSDHGHGRVCVFDGSGAYVREMGSSGEEQERLSLPFGLAVDCEWDIFVADRGNHRVVKYRGDGTFVRAIGSKGTKDGEFKSPGGVAVGGDGRIVVVDEGNAQVQVLRADGAHLLTIGRKGINGSGEGEFRCPRSAAVSAHGEILISDLDRGDMQLFSKDGKFLQRFGEKDICGVDVFKPGGVAVDADGRVFVCNLATNNVLMLA